MSKSEGESTQSDTPSRNTRGRAWCFTINNYTDETIANLKQLWDDTPTHYLFGEEKGEQGTPHLQGCVRFENARTFSAVKKMLPTAHIEPCKNWIAASTYCAKDGIVHRSKTESKAEIKTIENLYPWQQEIADAIETEPDDRTINWMYETEGCVGKTALIKYLCVKSSKNVICVSGKAADAKYGITSMMYPKKGKGKAPDVVIFTFTRTNEEFVSYEAIEAIKDGLFFNTKYESRQVVFNNPHVYVFANFRPKEGALSSDRWKIVEIEQKKSIHSHVPLPEVASHAMVDCVDPVTHWKGGGAAPPSGSASLTHEGSRLSSGISFDCSRSNIEDGLVDSKSAREAVRDVVGSSNIINEGVAVLLTDDDVQSDRASGDLSLSGSIVVGHSIGNDHLKACETLEGASSVLGHLPIDDLIRTVPDTMDMGLPLCHYYMGGLEDLEVGSEEQGGEWSSTDDGIV